MSNGAKIILGAAFAYALFFREKKAATPEKTEEPAKASSAPKAAPKSELPKKATAAAKKTARAPRFLKGEYEAAYDRVAAKISKGEQLTAKEVDDLKLIDSALSDAEFAKVLEGLNLTQIEYKQLVLLRGLVP